MLKALDERGMPDVVLWVLDRVAADKDAGTSAKQEVAFRRAAALVAVTKTEADPARRSLLLDDAQTAFDAFLESNPAIDRRVEALMQKGGLLMARGRAMLDQAKKPGADAAKLRADAASFFERAIATLQGKQWAKDEPITDVSNAENAVLKALREADAAIKAAAGGGAPESGEAADEKAAKPAKKPVKKSETRTIQRLEDDREALRGQLLQVRLMVADAYFDSSQALAPKSPEWQKAIDESTRRYAELFKKYPNRGAGLLARCNEARNYAALGDFPKALATLADMLKVEGSGDLITTLRVKSLDTALQCWLAGEQYDAFTDDLRKIALAAVPDDQLDGDVLGMKYRAALLLQRRAAAIPEAEKPKRNPLVRDARKMALEVAKTSREFALEARDLLEELGTDLDEITSADASFESLMDQAKLALTTMQEEQARAAAAGGDEEKKEARSAAAAARDQAIAIVSRALSASTREDVENVNHARSILTYLFHQAGRFHEAATLGTFLATRYPSGRGSSQAAIIAMASWQQLQKQFLERQADPAWAADAREKAGAAAESILRGWPDSKEAGDAAIVAMAAAVDARDPQRMAAVLSMVPPQSPRRAEVLLRAGTGVVRQCHEALRGTEADRPSDEELSALRNRAAALLDEGFAAIPAGAPADAVTVTAALSRCQLAMEEGADDVVGKFLEHPVYGPWTVANTDRPAGVPESVVGQAMTLALRYFIGTQQIPKAEQAMNLLEKSAGDGDEAAARLTAMYLAMGRDLQEQLRGLAAGGDAAAPERVSALLAGFEKFLDRVAQRDTKVASQMWVASTYDALASGEGTGAIVPRPKAAGYMDKAAAIYERLLGERSADIASYEPALRLKIAGMYRHRKDWDKARGHLDWFLSDAKRQNMIDGQVEAAQLAQAAAEAAGDAQQSASLFREAINGGKRDGSVSWGWAGIAKKLVRQAFSGTDDRAQRSQSQFFDARLNAARCCLAWAARDEKQRDKLLETATQYLAITYKLYPSLGGEATWKRYDALLRDVQTARGEKPEGLAAIDVAGEAAEKKE